MQELLSFRSQMRDASAEHFMQIPPIVDYAKGTRIEEQVAESVAGRTSAEPYSTLSDPCLSHRFDCSFIICYFISSLTLLHQLI